MVPYIQRVYYIPVDPPTTAQQREVLVNQYFLIQQ